MNENFSKMLQRLKEEARLVYNTRGMVPSDYQVIFEDSLTVYEENMKINKDWEDLYVNIWIEYAKFDAMARQRKHAKSVFEKAKEHEECRNSFQYWTEYAKFFESASKNVKSEKARKVYLEGVKNIWVNNHIS